MSRKTRLPPAASTEPVQIPTLAVNVFDLGPGFDISDEAKRGGVRAWGAVTLLPSSIRGIADDRALRATISGTLTMVANQYYHDKAKLGLTDAKLILADIRKIRKSADMLRAAFGKNAYAVSLIETLHRQSTASSRRDFIPGLTTELDQLIRHCKSFAKTKVSSGPISKFHVAKATLALAKLWVSLDAEHLWKKSFDQAAKKGASVGEKEYVFFGNTFVDEVLRAIDPDLTRGEVLSALKRLKKTNFIPDEDFAQPDDEEGPNIGPDGSNSLEFDLE